MQSDFQDVADHVQKNDYEVTMILHDSFAHYETYALCRKGDSWIVLIYNSADRIVHEDEFERSDEAFVFMLTTAFETYAMSISEHQEGMHAALLAANGLRAAVMNEIRANMHRGISFDDMPFLIDMIQ